MTLNGWIGIPRAVLAAEWYARADTFTRALWLHLMLSANFATTTTRTGLVLKPGQLVTSWAALAAELPSCDTGHPLKATRSKVRRAADYLRKAGEATYHPTGRPTHSGTVITLERWAFYAGVSEQPTQDAAHEPAGGVSPGRPHRNNTTGPVGPNDNSISESNGNGPTAGDLALRRRREAFDRECAESAAEVARIRAHERGEAVQ